MELERVCLLLAAGRGRRMGPLTDSAPKCMVEVGGRPLLEHQLEAVGDAGIRDTVVVAGYLADAVQQGSNGRCSVWVNHGWDEGNSILSLWRARQLAGRPLLLMNGDVLVGPGLLERLLAHPAPNAMLVDRRGPRREGELNVVAEEGWVRRVGAGVSPKESTAESLQVTKFDGEGSTVLFREAERLVVRAQTDAFPSAAFGAVAESGGLAAVPVEGAPWVEIDTPSDLERARGLGIWG